MIPLKIIIFYHTHDLSLSIFSSIYHSSTKVYWYTVCPRSTEPMRVPEHTLHWIWEYRSTLCTEYESKVVFRLSLPPPLRISLWGKGIPSPSLVLMLTGESKNLVGWRRMREGWMVYITFWIILADNLSNFSQILRGGKEKKSPTISEFLCEQTLRSTASGMISIIQII